jgi:1,4-dihydroxy-2-naphthoate octaprenyltransferase
MEVARHGSGARGVLGALLSQVHPVFMLPPLAASVFGAVLAREFAPVVGVSHVLAIFFALYTAHVKDGYVDFHVRGEDDDHPITADGCRLVLAVSSTSFFASLLGLWWRLDVGAALITLPAWLIAYFHAPQLDTNPVSATTGYPLGIAVALVGGYYVQVGALSLVALAFAVVFVFLLSGIKVIDDAKDYEYDRSIAKRTVAVVLGRERARLTAYGLMIGGLLAVLAFAALSIFPRSAALAVLAFAAVVVVSRRADSELATMLLIRGSYVFLALLVVAVWYRPFE